MMRPNIQSNPGAGTVEPRYFTIKQAAVYLSVNPRTVRRLVQQGKISEYRLTKDTPRYARDDLDLSLIHI